MLFFYLFACIPLAVGAFCWIRSKEVVWWEWVAGSVVGFAVSGICHLIAFHGLTTDVETWSGQIVKTTHHPKWIEEYQEMHMRTVGSGKNQRTEIYYTTEHRTHRKHWTCDISYGTKEAVKEITESFFDEIVKNFGDKIETVQGYRPGFDGGDRNDYVAHNNTGYVYPTIETYTWHNRVKAAPSVFTFAKVPKDVKVYGYPANKDWRASNRLLGTASRVNLLEWDRMNSRLGPTKKVNVILVGFGNQDKQMGFWQEAAWFGGKKNDLVLCFGSDGDKTTWSYVFGWTEQEIVKRNLETILLQNNVNTELIPKIEKEVYENYIIKEWDKFNYISIEPPLWSYIVLIVVMVASQTGFWWWAHHNEPSKEKRKKYGRIGLYY